MAHILLIAYLVSKSLFGLARFILILAITVLTTGCPGKRSSKNGKGSPAAGVDGGSQQNGGYDWGGGGAIKSPPGLVKRTIEVAQATAGEKTISKNLFREFLIWNLTTASGNQRFETTLLFPNSGNGVIEDAVRLTDSPALAAISLKKITLLASGDCPRPKIERVSDASVSKHSLDAEVCFSVGNLSLISPSDLTRQVTGLMLHEAVHMAGGDEELAIKFQESFNVYFGIRFGEMLGEAYLANVVPQLFDVVADLKANEDQIRTQMPIPHVYAVYGRAYGTLSRIHGLSDASGLKLRLGLKDAKAAEDFFRKAERLKEALGSNFYLSVGGNRSPVYSYVELSGLDVELRRLGKEMFDAWTKLEKASLCDEEGNFLYQPKTWLLEDTCKKPLT